jgi:hypothetical protein
MAFAVVGVLALLLRWAFGHGRSLVAPRPRPGHPEEYGLLVAVAVPDDPAAGEAAVRRLAAAGVRATLAPTKDGLRLMVFADDADHARRLLDGQEPHASK